MKRLLLFLTCALPIALFAQPVYTPNQHNQSSTATGYSNPTPADARSQFYDNTVFKYRDFQSTAEVLSYLNGTPAPATAIKKRSGHSPLFVHVGGTLSAGVWTGGTMTPYWFKDCLDDSCLVLMIPPALPTTLALPARSGTVTVALDGNKNYAAGVQTGDITFASSGNIEGAQALIVLDGNSINSITFPAGWINGNAVTADNTMRNRIYINRSSGETIYNIVKNPLPDVTPPVLSTAIVSAGFPGRIVLTYNEALDAASVPLTTDYTTSPSKTISSVTVSGATVNVNASVPFASADVITITGGASKVKDLAGNTAANLTARSVTNNISAVPGYADSFNRANSTVAIGNLDNPSSTAWAASTGTWGISSNKAYCVSQTGTGGTVFNSAYVNTTLSDYTYQVDLTISATSSGEIAFRVTDDANLWGIDVNGSTIALYKRVSGTVNFISGSGWPFSATTTFGTAYRYKIITNGNNISVYRNGSLLGTAFDTFNNTATKVGIISLDGTGLSTSALFDNFNLQ